jgi:hypothetical protein
MTEYMFVSPNVGALADVAMRIMQRDRLLRLQRLAHIPIETPIFMIPFPRILKISSSRTWRFIAMDAAGIDLCIHDCTASAQFVVLVVSSKTTHMRIATTADIIMLKCYAKILRYGQGLLCHQRWLMVDGCGIDFHMKLKNHPKTNYKILGSM